MPTEVVYEVRVTMYCTDGAKLHVFKQNTYLVNVFNKTYVTV